MPEHIEKPLNSALKAVDLANARVIQLFADLNDPARRKRIVEEVRQEVAEAPGFLTR